MVINRLQVLGWSSKSWCVQKEWQTVPTVPKEIFGPQVEKFHSISGTGIQTNLKMRLNVYNQEEGGPYQPYQFK